MARVKGTKISSKLAFLRSEYDEHVTGRVLASMSAEDRQALGFVLDVGWYPQDLYERLLRAICTTAAGGDPAVYRRIGRHSAEHQFSHAYRAYRATELAETLRNMVPVHARMNDPGAMEVVLDGERATIVVTAPRSSPLICAVSRAFYERVVELHGAASVTVEEPECTGSGAPRCRFELRWTGRAS